MNRIVVFGVGVALIVASTLNADDNTDNRFRFGAGVSFVIPKESNTIKSGPGYGPFFTAEMKLTDRQSLRGELGYVRFRETNVDLETKDYLRPVSHLSLGADWLYSFSPDNRGFYVLCGADVLNNAWKSFQLDPSGNLYSSSHNNFRSFMNVGGGWSTKWFRIEYVQLYDFAGRLARTEWGIEIGRQH
jgi:hypothetical protein